MTRNEYDDFIANLYAPLHERRQREQEQQPVAQARNLTDAEMARWRDHFERRLASEREATEARVASEREFLLEVVGGALGEMRHAIGGETKLAIDAALASVQSSLATLHQDMAKRTGVEAGKITELPNPIKRHHGNATA